MKYKWDKKYLYWGVTAFCVIAAGLVFYYFLFHGSEITSHFSAIVKITMPIIDGFALAYLQAPVLNAIERNILKPMFEKLHIRQSPKTKSRMRGIGIIMTLIFFLVIIYFLFYLIVPQILESLQSIIRAFPYYMNNTYIYVGRLLDENPQLDTMITNLLRNYSTEMEAWLNEDLLPQVSSILKNLTGSMVGLAVGVWNLIIGLIISVYLLNGKETFAAQGKKLMYSLFKEQRASLFIHNLRFTHKTFGGFIGGKLLDSLIIGVLCFIGVKLLNIPYAILISVIIGITNIIPFFGPYLGAIPSALILLMVDPVKCLYFLIFILILQQFDGNVIGPKILGDSTGLSSFWVIFSITLFGGLWGVLGMIIGVPLFALIYAAIKAVSGKMLDNRRLSSDTADYMNLDFIEDRQYHYFKEQTREEYHFEKKNHKVSFELGRPLRKDSQKSDSEQSPKKTQEDRKPDSESVQEAFKEAPKTDDTLDTPAKEGQNNSRQSMNKKDRKDGKKI